MGECPDCHNIGTLDNPDFVYSDDPYVFGSSSAVFAAAISGIQSARNEFGEGFAYPYLQTDGMGRYGPNFQYVEIPGNTVPDAARTVSLIAISLAGFAAWRRKFL